MDCTICGKKGVAKDLCHMHYSQQPIMKQRKKEYDRKRRQVPSMKLKFKLYESRLEVRKRRKEPHKRYVARNQEKIIAYRKSEKVKERKRLRYQSDINYRLSCLLRTRLTQSIIWSYKPENTLDLLGCSVDELKEHLENQFTNNMSWDNWGKWHIDHIKPCNQFDLSIKEDRLECFNFTNLRPLWAKDNLARPRASQTA